MFHFYTIFFLSLFLTYSISKDIEKYYPNRTIVSSRTIYDLVQLRLAASRIAKTYRNNTQLHNRLMKNQTYASRMKIPQSNIDRNQFLFERLKIIVFISATVLLLMIIIVITCIVARYYQDKHFKPTQRAPERKRHTTTRYIRTIPDKRNFARKSRTLPTAV